MRHEPVINKQPTTCHCVGGSDSLTNQPFVGQRPERYQERLESALDTYICVTLQVYFEVWVTDVVGPF